MTIIDPLEQAAEVTDWLTFVQEIEATIPFPDSTSADPNIVWADAISGVPKPYGGTVGPNAVFEYDFVAPWEGMLGNTAVDAETGITVPLDIKGSPISPAFYDSATKTWSVNPAYTAWAVTRIAAAGKPSLVNVPAPDPPVPFRMSGLTPSWADVYRWQTDVARAENANLQGQYAVTGDQVARAVDVAMGTTTKALSGYISHLTETIAWLSRAVKTRVDAVQLALYNVASNLNARIEYVRKVQDLILRLAIPSLQSQITQETHNRRVSIVRHDEAMRTHVRDDVYVPLNTSIQANQITATQQTEALAQSIPDRVRQLAPELIAPALLATTALATRVTALEAEAAECVRPMCAMLGPKTDLGKFLKALKVAEWLALLAELAALRADGLDGLLTDVEQWAATAIGTFEDAFFTGGKTLGETVTGIG